MKRIIKFLKKLAYLLLFSFFISCNNHSSNKEIVNNDTFVIKVYSVDSLGWGYDICKDKKAIIHQPTIPAINGNVAFKTKENANKTAELVVEKLKNNVFPPSLTKEEVEQITK